MSMYGLPHGLTNPPRHSLTSEEMDDIVHADTSWMGPAPGTFVLVFVFLAAFVTYFFVNWKMLSFLWLLG
jgi:hypothetical protein